MLEAAVLMQNEEGCTFTPVITRKSKAQPKDHRPVRDQYTLPLLYILHYISAIYRVRQVHIRLTDQGRHYTESLEKLRDNVRKYDDCGRRLFTPAINREPASASAHKSTVASEKTATESGGVGLESGDAQQDDTPPPPPPAAANKKQPPHPAHSSAAATVPATPAAAPAAADEFLYQDARDREERYRMREREQQSQIEARAAASKMNASSMTLLRRKAVRAFPSLGLGPLLCSS
jgi:hypothetical protein